MKRNFLTAVTLMMGWGSLFASTHYQGDFNDDGKVNLADMVILASVIKTGTDNLDYDMNASGAVDEADLKMLGEYVLEDKLVEGSLNVGIGGWDDAGEDFGGVVKLPFHSSRSGDFGFYIQDPEYDFNEDQCYIGWGMTGGPLPLCGLLIEAEFPDFVSIDSGKLDVLAENLFSELPMLGSCKVEDNRKLRFLLFDMNLHGCESLPETIGRIYLDSPFRGGEVKFTGCQVVGPTPESFDSVDSQSIWKESWSARWLRIKADEYNEIEEGESLLLSVDIYPSDAPAWEVVWNSSDSSVVTVDQTGTLTALNIGEAIITASLSDDSSVSASVTFRVKENQAAEQARQEAYAQGNAEVQTLRDALAAALNTIAEQAPDVKDNFRGEAISADINELQAALDAAYEDKTIADRIGELLVPVPAIESAIEKLVEDALAAQQAYEDAQAAEQARQEANFAAYTAAMAEVDALQQKLDTAIAEIREKYPDFEVDEAAAPIQNMIDTLWQAVEAAYEAVANEGIFDYTVDGSEVEHSIEIMMEAAGVNSVMGETLNSKVHIYTMDGVQVENFVHGQVNLIVYPDGHCVKVYVK